MNPMQSPNTGVGRNLCSRELYPAKELPLSGSERRLVLPRSHGLRHRQLGAHLDAINSATDAAIHRGYCKRNVRKLDAALVRIIAEAEAAREILR